MLADILGTRFTSKCFFFDIRTGISSAWPLVKLPTRYLRLWFPVFKAEVDITGRLKSLCFLMVTQILKNHASANIEIFTGLSKLF